MIAVSTADLLLATLMLKGPSGAVPLDKTTLAGSGSVSASWVYQAGISIYMRCAIVGKCARTSPLLGIKCSKSPTAMVLVNRGTDAMQETIVLSQP